MSPSRDANSELPSVCEVVIVGAGPIGLMLANLLGTAGVNVVVFEKNDRLVGLPRAIAYDPETLRLFAQVGLFDRIVDGLVQDPQVVYLNARGVKLMEITPQRSAYGYSQLGTFYQPHFEKVLFDGLARFESVRALFNHCVASISQDQHGVDIQVETPAGRQSLRAKFLVGCDGGNSGTRGWIGSRLVGSTYAERWLVIDGRIDNHGVDNITFFCDPRRPTVRLPAVGSRVRWEFMQLAGEKPDELVSDDSVGRLLAPYVDLSAVEIERRVVYTFHARVADKWRNGRVLLAGDAAHLMPPFAGQGMNGGMKDVANLAWKLAAVVTGSAGDEILDTYEVERAHSVRAMVNLSRRLGAVIMPTNRMIAAARDAAFALLNLSAGFRSFVRRGGMLPPPHISRSALTAARRDPVVGQMLPKLEVTAAGDRRPLDLCIGCHQWLVLGVGIDPRAELSSRDSAILDGLGARFLAVNSPAATIPTQSLQCQDQAFLAWAKSHRLRGLLVRPDRFVAKRLDLGCDLRSLDPFAGLADKSRRAAELQPHNHHDSHGCRLLNTRPREGPRAMNAHIGMAQIAAAKLQHHVIYVSDLQRSTDFYTKLFDLQFSALNHPDSSAAMRLAHMEMHFFSFGFYHHDICLVKHHKLKMDNGSMLHFSLVARDRTAFDAIRQRAKELGIQTRDGRLIASAKALPGGRAFCLQDPDRHWIEIIEEPSK